MRKRWLGPVGIAVGLVSVLATFLISPRAGGPSVGALVEPVVLLVLAFAVARWAERLIVGAPIVIVALAVMVLRYSATPELDAGGKVLAVGLWGAAGAAAALLGWGLRGLERARTATRQAEAYRRRLAVAAELHDFVAHDLSEVVARIQAARYLGGGPDDLERIERAGVRSLESLEATVRALQLDGVPDGSGRDLEALPELIERFNAVPGPRAVLVAPGKVDVSAEGSALVYRMVTECLTNLRKHAPDATRVRITIKAGSEVVAVTVVDDGAEQAGLGSRSGLRMLTERADALGGSLTAGPAENAGWQVELVVPR